MLTGSERRLPVYLVLDCSGSMQGEPIEAVRQGVQRLVSDLCTDPQALETVHLSVIAFSDSARQTVPLTAVLQFQEPELEARGTTALGQALEVLMGSMARDVHRTTPERKGDWKPLVFILSDGCPTDINTFREAAPKLKQRTDCNIIACGLGSHADSACLKQITDNVLMLNADGGPDLGLSEFFKWVSDSVRVSSSSLDSSRGAPVAMPEPPAAFCIVP